MQKQNHIFFCENCVLPRTSIKHLIRVTKDGIVIVQDTCEVCKAKQEIESMDEKEINKFRIKQDDNKE